MSDGERIRVEMDALKQDIDRLRADLGGLLQAVRSEGSRQGENAKVKLREETMRRMDQLKDVWDTARDYGQKTYIKAHRGVGQRPMVSILTAFGAGLLIGRLLLNRK